uniref:Uncharacterized protein n=1 Tax=Timema shepardi TaxID=629360 RepID=A0A7R9AZN6_TIMSH|nr:unnamed protein product [Timema shepardi]
MFTRTLAEIDKLFLFLRPSQRSTYVNASSSLPQEPIQETLSSRHTRSRRCCPIVPRDKEAALEDNSGQGGRCGNTGILGWTKKKVPKPSKLPVRLKLQGTRRGNSTFLLVCDETRMESWLLDVKRVRIPRPKFASTRYPAEPPKDYLEEVREETKKRDFASRELDKVTEELRRAVQDKL